MNKTYADIFGDDDNENKKSGNLKGKKLPQLPDFSDFLPTTKDEIIRCAVALDFLIVTGDAYVDGCAFGAAVIGRWLQYLGYVVGIIAQPKWEDTKDFEALGKPRLGVMITAGNMDSMVSNYTAEKKRRKKDMYSPGGAPQLRPDRATIVYCNKIRELWKDVPLIIGGVEASLRRFAHYDYTSDAVRRSLLVDARADYLVYGMGELAVQRLAHCLANGLEADIPNIPGLCYKTHNYTGDALVMPSYEQVSTDKRAFCEAFKLAYDEQDPFKGHALVQDNGSWCVVQNPPSPPLTTEQLDTIYELPYTGRAHPMYDSSGGVPAAGEVEYSLTAHRGCFGRCSFCALTMHQGARIQRRSAASLVREATKFSQKASFNGIISDVGGPTANFHTPPCERAKKDGVCAKSCLGVRPCKNIQAPHAQYSDILRQLMEIDGIKKVFVRSGVRYDYAMASKEGRDFLAQLCAHHVSGQLRVAPEHVSSAVLSAMNKPPKESLLQFMQLFSEQCAKSHKEQYLVLYFMTGHPGCTLEHSVELAQFLREQNIRPREVQDFTPTPGTASSCMYHTGINPFTGEEIYVPKTSKERRQQRALAMCWHEDYEDTAREALLEMGRKDLVGYGGKSLVRPKKT